MRVAKEVGLSRGTRTLHVETETIRDMTNSYPQLPVEDASFSSIPSRSAFDVCKNRLALAFIPSTFRFANKLFLHQERLVDS